MGKHVKNPEEIKPSMFSGTYKPRHSSDQADDRKPEEVAADASDGITSPPGGQHTKDPNQVRDDIIAAFREIGERLNAKVEVIEAKDEEDPFKGVGEHGAVRKDAPEDLWGRKSHFTTPVPKMADILVDASLKNDPVKLLVNGEHFIGRVLAVNDEVLALELWDGDLGRFAQPKTPRYAYIDLVAVDAVRTLHHKEFQKVPEASNG